MCRIQKKELEANVWIYRFMDVETECSQSQALFNSLSPPPLPGATLEALRILQEFRAHVWLLHITSSVQEPQ